MPTPPINTEQEEARERARLAMGGKKIEEKEMAENKNTEEMRRLARLAMEGSERRIRRETREKEAIDREMMRKRIDEEVKRRQAEEAQKKAAEEEARRTQQAAKEQELKQKENEFVQSQNIIEQLKNEQGSSLHPLRTLQSDLAGAVQNEKLSATKIAISEQERAPRSIISPEESPFSIWKTLTILFIFLILIIGGGAGGYWYWINKTNTTAGSNIVVQSIIYAETSTEIDTTKVPTANLISTVTELLTAPATAGETINNIYFTKVLSSPDGKTTKKSLLSFPEWQKYSQSAIPEDFSRFVNDYMIGLYKGSEEKSLFFTFKIDLFDNVFQTLLDHEGDYLPNIFKNLDGKNLVGTSTKQTFSDRLIKNINTRVLTNDQGKIVMIYSFLDRNTLVIAESEDALYRAYVAYNTPRPKN